MELFRFIKPTQLTFENKQLVVGDVYSYTFIAKSQLTWQAGQHGMLEIKLPNGKTARRMFSLSSAPTESRVTVTTHWQGEKSSDYKRALWNLQPSDTAKMRGPVGPMYIRDPAAKYVLIAGGIGITPFRSILVEAVSQHPSLHATLLYATRDEDTIAFRDELDSLSKELANVSINYITSPQTIDEQVIVQASKDLSDTMYYLSGPPSMVKNYKRRLRKMGVFRNQIKSDPFMGYKL